VWKGEVVKDAGLQPCRVPGRGSNLGAAPAGDVAGSGYAAVVPAPGMARAGEACLRPRPDSGFAVR